MPNPIRKSQPVVRLTLGCQTLAILPFLHCHRRRILAISPINYYTHFFGRSARGAAGEAEYEKRGVREIGRL